MLTAISLGMQAIFEVVVDSFVGII
jgi:hypothetical protein